MVDCFNSEDFTLGDPIDIGGNFKGVQLSKRGDGLSVSQVLNRTVDCLQETDSTNGWKTNDGLSRGVSVLWKLHHRIPRVKREQVEGLALVGNVSRAIERLVGIVVEGIELEAWVWAAFAAVLHGGVVAGLCADWHVALSLSVSGLFEGTVEIAEEVSELRDAVLAFNWAAAAFCVLDEEFRVAGVLGVLLWAA